MYFIATFFGMSQIESEVCPVCLPVAEMNNRAYSLDPEEAARIAYEHRLRGQNERTSLPYSDLYEEAPINISRHIFYTENIFHRDRCRARVLQSSGEVNRPNRLQSTIDTLRKYSKQIWPLNQQATSVVGFFKTLVPILHWLPNYNFQEDFKSDVNAGVAIFALNIPQGLAYGRLAGVSPIYGLYVSLFPVLIYALFGTSRQVSIGKLSIVFFRAGPVQSNTLFQELLW